MKVAIVNLGQIVSGDWHVPFAAGDTVLIEGERIATVGSASSDAVEGADVVIDAGGMTVIPGLIDSHVHVTFGDYTPRQETVGYLESYVHGGVTTAIGASEVHVPGRWGGQSTCGRSAEVLRTLQARWHDCPRRLHHSRAWPDRERPRRGREERRLARQGRFRRVPERLRVRATNRRRPCARHDYDGAYRRIFNSRFGRDHRRPLARAQTKCLLPYQRRPNGDAGRRFRAS